jgi:hypothetical protein
MHCISYSSLGHIKQTERHLENYQFYLNNGNAMNELFIFDLNDNLYYALRSLSAFFGKLTNWCDLCREAYHTVILIIRAMLSK